MATLRFDDRESLSVITPLALSYYARSEGWERVGTYRAYSHIYGGNGRPEILVPHTDAIDDYALAVSDLIAVFARTLDRDELSVYRDLTLADRDVVRVRAQDADPDGLPFGQSHAMLDATRRMMTAAAHSLGDDRPVYPAQASGNVNAYLNRIRLGHTEGGSFALVLVSPVIAPPLGGIPAPEDENDTLPRERLVAQRLSQSLFAARSAVARAAGGDTDAFAPASAISAAGVSANLCEAVADLIISVATFDVSFSWAITRPSEARRGPIAFSHNDVPLLQGAAKSMRQLEPEYGRRLYGFIYRLTRAQVDIDGTVGLRTAINGASRSVSAVLNNRDYALAIEAHRSNAIVCLEGDLERGGSGRRHLHNAKLVETISAPPLPGMAEA